MSETFLIEAARGEELQTAFSLMYQHLPLIDRQRGLRNALELVKRGDLGHEQILVVRGEDDQLAGMMVYSPNAGAAGQVWPPQVAAAFPREEVEDALVQATIARLQACGARFIQALLPAEDEPLTPALLRAGFQQVTSLLTLRHPLYHVQEPPDLDEVLPLTWQTFAEADRGLFQQTLLETYEATLDFPELNGIRDVGNIILAHEKHGRFHPDCWFLVWHRGQPVGVLLLVELPDANEWELSYIGVIPAARGQGIGRAMVREAVRLARQLETSQLVVAVDARNVPAWSLYARLGFCALDEHRVYLLILKDS